MKKNKVTISLAAYNNLEYTKQCLLALFAKTPLELFDLVIVNNGSSDGTTEWLAKELPTLIPFDKNRITIFNIFPNFGFAKAHNKAFEECKTEYFLPLNNDIIPWKHWLEPLVEDLDKMPEVAIVGSKLISPLLNGIQNCGTLFQGVTPYHRYLGYPPQYPSVNQKEYVPAITGACFIIRSKLFKQFHGFDTRYYNGWEDVHLNLQLLEAGWKILYEPRSVLYHYEGRSEDRFIKDSENRQLFYKLWSRKLLNGLGQLEKEKA